MFNLSRQREERQIKTGREKWGKRLEETEGDAKVERSKGCGDWREIWGKRDYRRDQGV